MEDHRFVRDKLSDLLEPAKPDKNALGAWQDTNNDEFLIYDNRFSDSESIRLAERYGVKHDGEVKEFAYAQQVVDYVKKKADGIKEEEISSNLY